MNVNLRIFPILWITLLAMAILLVAVGLVKTSRQLQDLERRYAEIPRQIRISDLKIVLVPNGTSSATRDRDGLTYRFPRWEKNQETSEKTVNAFFDKTWLTIVDADEKPVELEQEIDTVDFIIKRGFEDLPCFYEIKWGRVPLQNGRNALKIAVLGWFDDNVVKRYGDKNRSVGLDLIITTKR